MSQRSEPEPYDVITMGRIGVDLYPLRTGVPLAKVDVFGKFLGGSATNVAVGAARLGRRSAVITRTGADAFGDYLHDALRDFGVDDRWVTPVHGLPTPVTFCEIFPPDDFPLWFYRQPKAPDLELHQHELDLPAIRSARVFWVTGTGLSEEPSRSTTLAALAHRDRAGITVFDLDWRPMFWRDPDAARSYYHQALTAATVAVGNLDECEIATGERDPLTAARALLEAGAELAVVKQGPKGVLALHRDGTRADVPPVPVAVVNGLGAGDAFGGALCHGLLAGWDLERVMRYANAAGAIVAARLACSTAMPYPAEVDQVLSGGPVPRSPTPPPQAPAPQPDPFAPTAQLGETSRGVVDPADSAHTADPAGTAHLAQPADPPQLSPSATPQAKAPPPKATPATPAVPAGPAASATPVAPAAATGTEAPTGDRPSRASSAPVPPSQDSPGDEDYTGDQNRSGDQDCPGGPRAPSTERPEGPGGRP